MGVHPWRCCGLQKGWAVRWILLVTAGTALVSGDLTANASAPGDLQCNLRPTAELIVALNATLTAAESLGQSCFPPIDELTVCLIGDLGQPLGCPCSADCHEVASKISPACIRTLRDSRCELYRNFPSIQRNREDEDQIGAFIGNCIPDAVAEWIPCDSETGNAIDTEEHCKVSSSSELFDNDFVRGVLSGQFSCVVNPQDFAICIPFLGVPANCSCSTACNQHMATYSRACVAAITEARCLDPEARAGDVFYTSFFGNCAPQLLDLLDCSVAANVLDEEGSSINRATGSGRQLPGSGGSAPIQSGEAVGSAGGDGGGGSDRNTGLIIGIVLAVVAALGMAAALILLQRKWVLHRRANASRKGSKQSGGNGVLARVPEVEGLVKGQDGPLQGAETHAPPQLPMVTVSCPPAENGSQRTPRQLLRDLESQAALLSEDPRCSAMAHQARKALAQLEGGVVSSMSASYDEDLFYEGSTQRPVCRGSEDVVLNVGTSSVEVHGSSHKPQASDSDGQHSPTDNSASGSDRFSRNTSTLITRLLPELPEVDMNVDVEKDIEFRAVIGQGAFGSVYMGMWTGNDGSRRPVAVKVMRASAIFEQMQKSRLLRTFSSELNIMARIDHPHVVRCYGGCVRNDIACLLLEYMEGGSLDKYIYDTRKDVRLNDVEVLCVAKQVASALAYLHPLIVHADIKPPNVLLDANGALKIADFGLSRIKVQTALSQQIGGTMAYLAPEAMRQERVTEKCDIYSLGVLIWECMVGEPPWKDVVNFQIMHKVCLENVRPHIPDGAPRELRSLISSCWSQQPQLRPSAHELYRKTDVLIAAAVSHSEQQQQQQQPAEQPSQVADKAEEVL